LAKLGIVCAGLQLTANAGAGFLSSTDHFLGFYPIGIDIIILLIQL
jgi:hypothetical protein